MFSVREKGFEIVQMNNLTTEELIREGEYSGVNKELTSNNFPFRVCQSSKEVKKIRFVEIITDCFVSDVLLFANTQKFKELTYEDALLFGAQNKGLYNKTLCFLHKPWDEKNLVIREDTEKRHLDLYYVYSRMVRRMSFLFPFIED